MKIEQLVAEHKKGVRAKIYNKKPTTHAGPEVAKKPEHDKKKSQAVSEESKLYKHHQELRKKRGLPDPSE